MRHLVLIVLAISLVGCHHGTTTESIHEVRIALPRDGITWLPVRLAKTLGYFADQKLNVIISDVAGLSKGMEALLGGSVEVAAGGLTQTMQVAAEGRSVRTFVLLYTRPLMALAVAPNMTGKINDIAGLKKRNIGITSPGSTTHQQLNFLLVTHGLLPADVSIVSIGTGASSLSSLERGKVDAAILVGSAIGSFKNRNPNTVLLADSRSAEGSKAVFGSDSFPSTAVMAEDRWLKANPDTARRFAASVLKGMEWMRTHSAEDVRAKMPESDRMPDVEADLQGIRDVQKSLSPDGVMPDAGLDQVRKFVEISSDKVRAAKIDIRRVYTNEFVTAK